VRRRLGIAIAVALAAVATGCGEKSERGPTAGPEQLTLALDFSINADHAGIYEAIDRGYFADAGLDVRPQVPSDPSAPIREVAAGRADLAISYEPEVLLARDQGLPVKAVAALVQRPLTSLISLKSAGINSVADLRTKTIVTAGIPYQQAYLDAILARAGLTAADVNVVDVQLSLLPPVVSGRADAMLGGFSNIEGVELGLRGLAPRVVPVDRLGIPTYDELVLVASSDRLASDPRPIQLFIAALERGTKAAASDPGAATKAILDASQNLDARITRAEINRTLPLLDQRGTGKPFGYMDPAQWTKFAHFFADHSLIQALPAPGDVLTNDLLPGKLP
jgi:putative hydroxymethylpyrimidine transport system substrate-binding protein